MISLQMAGEMSQTRLGRLGRCLAINIIHNIMEYLFGHENQTCTSEYVFTIFGFFKNTSWGAFTIFVFNFSYHFILNNSPTFYFVQKPPTILKTMLLHLLRQQIGKWMIYEEKFFTKCERILVKNSYLIVLLIYALMNICNRLIS